MDASQVRRRAVGAVALASLVANVGQRAYLTKQRQALAVDVGSGLIGHRGWERNSRRHFRILQDSGECGALLLLDVDHLKAINDTHGHSCGNDAIALVGEAIRVSIRRADVTARIGGDEFAALIGGVTASDCHSVATRIRKRLAELCAEHPVLDVTISVGVATFPDDGVDLSELLAAADRALYRDKRARRPVSEIFAPR